jgi:hypothetical protein
MKKQSDASILKNLMPLEILRKDSSKSLGILNMVNRAIVPSHVTSVATSIEKIGLIRPVVVAKLNLKEFKGEYIIDGQHLFNACIRLNKDVPYVKIDVSSEEELIDILASLNNSSKPWTLKDYVQSWAYIRPDFKKLAKYRQTYDLELVAIAGILHRSPNIFQCMNLIKKGELVIKNESLAVKIMEYTNDVLSIFYKFDRKNARKLVNAYVQYVTNTHDSYNHKKFLSNLNKQKSKLELVMANPDDVTDFFYKIA